MPNVIPATTELRGDTSVCDVSKLTVSVVICAYTSSRWAQLQAAVASLTKQTRPADEIVVVIDHNETLFREAHTALHGARVLENSHAQGLSGARNSGVAVAEGSVIAFIDDDAVAEPDWLEQLLKNYWNPQVLGVGGGIGPLWPARKATWFPAEFLWVLGCSYVGMPTTTGPVRNLIGCNMSFRRSVFNRIGGFSTELGRLGNYPAGCEETELCIRLSQQLPGHLLYDPQAQVSHEVTNKRLTFNYFITRCYAEGLSKARVSRAVGAADGLTSERTYTLQTLPRGVVREGMSALRERNPAGLTRAGSIVIGFCATAVGYLKGLVVAPVARKRLDDSLPPFSPARVVELNIDEPLPDIANIDAETGATYTRAFALVRSKGRPLDLIEIELGEKGVAASDLATLLDGRFASSVHSTPEDVTASSTLRSATLRSAVLDSKGSAMTPENDAQKPFVSVIIATHNRTQGLATCLESLGRQNYPNFEIIVVDNAPDTDETFRFMQRYTAQQVRYVREDTPGLARAHNRGLIDAKGSVVAFTDDDVRVDPHWLGHLVESFDLTTNVGCVTGMIVPAEMETSAQAWLEQYGGFSKGFRVKFFNLTNHRPKDPLYPYTAGVFGSGANMAFTREALGAIGGFDPALGAGSKGVGGDDLAAFFDVVASGYTLVYQPAAVVHHWHHREYGALQRQAYGYGVGLTAFLTRVILNQPKRLLEIAPLVPRAVIYALSPASPKNTKKRTDYPRELSTLERRGMLYGPLAYVKSHLSVRRLGAAGENLLPARVAEKAGL
ncbi:MAG: hypothetical protein AVDCRST_MAG86-4287 [uncultured Truepera sp.]|uniref:Glycosyltransferase 2-like domain-containing protein n=1 Tax=uncultured Truepera sp. TaxID=543023 RepID=A0A6J4VXE1_9DEIN|nr:MAG: hypothetical protein AVDCRST_MAG86-4287 [uncultured Truepera sp.]